MLSVHVLDEIAISPNSIVLSPDIRDDVVVELAIRNIHVVEIDDSTLEFHGQDYHRVVEWAGERALPE